jgi:hypothetical protein
MGLHKFNTRVVFNVFMKFADVASTFIRVVVSRKIREIIVLMPRIYLCIAGRCEQGVVR